MITRYRRGFILGAGAALVAVAACSGGDARNASGADTAQQAVRAVNVEVMEVQPREFTEMLRVTGNVRASRDVVIAAEESGPVRAVLVEKGSTVRAGQPLLRIDDALLRTQLQQAEAAAQLARETYERRRRLWETDKVGSELAYLQARAEAQQTAAQVATLRQRIARTVIRAPFDGTLEERRVEVGSMVAPGTPLARIIDATPVKVQGGIPERFAQQVENGREVQVTLDAAGESLKGRISFVGSAVDQQNRTFPIEVELPNPAGRIKPEMVATIVLPLRRLEEALVVPQQALVRAEGGFIAYVAVDRGGTMVAEQRAVTLGPLGGNEAVVLGGISAGDRLIVVGHNKVADGDVVNLVGAAKGGAE